MNGLAGRIDLCLNRIEEISRNENISEIQQNELDKLVKKLYREFCLLNFETFSMHQPRYQRFVNIFQPENVYNFIHHKKKFRIIIYRIGGRNGCYFVKNMLEEIKWFDISSLKEYGCGLK